MLFVMYTRNRKGAQKTLLQGNDYTLAGPLEGEGSGDYQVPRVWGRGGRRTLLTQDAARSKSQGYNRIWGVLDHVSFTWNLHGIP